MFILKLNLKIKYFNIFLKKKETLQKPVVTAITDTTCSVTFTADVTVWDFVLDIHIIAVLCSCFYRFNNVDKT